MKVAKYETSVGALAAWLATKPQAAGYCDLYSFVLAGTIQVSGNVSNGSNVIGGIANTTGILVGMLAGGPGIPAGTTVSSVGSNSVNLSANASGNTNGAALSFGSWLPLTYATSDVDVVVPYASGAVTYSSQQVYFDQINNKAYGHQKIGTDTESWTVRAAPSAQALIGGQPWLSAVRARFLSGALVIVDRAYFDNRAGGLPQGALSLTPLGVVNVFTGMVAEVDLGRTNADITLNSPLERLGIKMPRNLLQPGCRWTLFDNGCTLIAANFAVAGSAAAGTSSNVLSANLASPGGSGTYALGRVVMTSGQNSGVARAVRSWTPGTPASLTLIAPFPFPVAPGDTFTAYPGCDKQFGTCGRFGNTTHFGGFISIPAPETAV